jgi:3-oxoacyl-[acyl-carrier protein] reductase
VVVTGRTRSDLESLASEIKAKYGTRAVVVPGSVSRAEDVRHAVDTALKEFGKIDILVNNAGIPGPVKNLQDITESEWDEVINTNVKGVFLFTKQVLPHMLAQKSGNIVNISSGAGEKHQRMRRVRSLPYNVSKFAIEGFNNVLASSTTGTGVNVNALKPGPLRTAFHAGTPPEILREMEQRTGMPGPDYVTPVALYLATLAPGELNGESIDVATWIKDHPSTN